MARKNRADLINKREVNIYHITDRCVRRAFLMGRNKAAGQSFDYRRRGCASG